VIEICFSIGSNIGNRPAYLHQALNLMGARIGIIEASSAFYESASWGFDSEPFLNAVVVINTTLSPIQCFIMLEGIETEMGRVRSKTGYADRVIDIDILSYGQRCFSTKQLSIPHPRLSERRFVLLPWAEVRPFMIVPGYNKRVKELLEQCKDKGACKKWGDV
jgi:2-amino-4-hydroxy-6-hydroxymethyldihydropteridine diphosphokinase